MRGEAAFGRDVHDEHDFALIGFQGGAFAIDVLDGNVIDGVGCLGEDSLKTQHDCEEDQCFHAADHEPLA